MSDTPPPSVDEARAAKRFFLLGIMRVITIGVVILGISIARGALDASYWLGVVLAISGMLAFFFGPPILAKRWKAGDRALEDKD